MFTCAGPVARLSRSPQDAPEVNNRSITVISPAPDADSPIKLTKASGYPALAGLSARLAGQLSTDGPANTTTLTGYEVRASKS